MEPFHFGRDHHLFGFFHPNVASARRGGLLIAPPLLSEGIPCHYALRQLAVDLCHLGYDVLRFDFSGCGDSLGDLKKLSIQDWHLDLRDAHRELTELSGSAVHSVLAVRFSSALVADAVELLGWDAMVFWDPVLAGESWLSQMRSKRESGGSTRLAEPDEYLGEETSPEFTRSVKEFRSSVPSGRPVIAITTEQAVDLDPKWQRRELAFSFGWNQSSVENRFAHSIIDETVKVFLE